MQVEGGYSLVHMEVHRMGPFKRPFLLFSVVAILILGMAALAQASQITLTGKVRDFLPAGYAAGIYNGNPGVGHIDFENYCCGDDHNIVTSTLGVNGKPVYAGGSVSTHGATAFNQWFNDTP